MNCLSAFSVLAAMATMTLGCVSTRSVGYSDGWVKTSPVSYGFSGPPVLSDMDGQTYRVTVDGAAGSTRLKTFDRHGMQSTASAADVEVQITMGKPKQSKAGAAKIGKFWYPAFTVTVPYEISVKRGGEQLTSRRSKYDNALTFKGSYRFESREKAVAAIDTIRKLGQKGIEKKSRDQAVRAAQQNTNELTAGLFKERNISMEVPVVRAAAGLDLEACYTMLSKAKNPEQVQEALAAYESLGTEHRKADGSPNKTANYGVACGIAATKLLLRDLEGAWAASKVANQFEPKGEEVDQIRYVIYKQEKITGMRVIPEADRAAIAKQEKMAGALQKLFAAPSR